MIPGADPHAARMLRILSDLDRLDVLVDDHVEALRWARDHAENAVTSASAQEAQIEELEGALEDEKTRNKELQDQVDELEKEAKILASDRDGAMSDRDALRDEVASLEAELTALRAKAAA